jgi:hypothetical protein
MKEPAALCGLPSFFASQLPGKIAMRGSGSSQVPEEAWNNIMDLTILPSLIRRSRNQKGHNIKKMETSSPSAESPMNSGDRAEVENFSTKNVPNSNG